MKDLMCNESLATLFNPSLRQYQEKEKKEIIIQNDKNCLTDIEKEFVGDKEEGDEEEILNEDFKLARDSISSVLETSKTTMKSLVDLSNETDSPRAFEAISTLITAISSAAKDLLSLHEFKSTIRNNKKQKTENSNPQNQTNIQNNIMFKGSTKELLEMIRTQK